MQRYLILARSKHTADALQRVLALALPEEDAAQSAGPEVAHVVVPISTMTPDRAFDHIADRIVASLGGDGPSIPVGRTAVLVDCLDLACASPLSPRGWDATIAMLILAFPEVHWFVGVLQCPAPAGPALIDQHSLAALLCGRHADPLFDGSGLRDAIRRAIAEPAGSAEACPAPQVPARGQVATALDDEVSYAYFNAYTAYRFGFRAFTVCRNSEAESMLGPDRTASHTPYVTFEDIYLNFPDNTGRQHYSDLGSEAPNGRRKSLPALEDANYRIFVTTEHRHAGDDDKHRRNHSYIASSDCVPRGTEPNSYGTIVLKPYSGMFALWAGSKLGRRLHWIVNGRTMRGIAPAFLWPPPRRPRHDSDPGHSAPGRLLQVATHMIIRCETMLRAGVHTVPDAVRCAVLATDALELLGNRTPMTGMDALAFKHLAEVTAECQFSGLEYHIDLFPRLREIERDARCLSRSFHPRRRVLARMNSEMTTLVELMPVLRRHGQFDEALICQNRVRHLHNRLWMRQKRARVVFWPALKYIEVILASFGWFLASIVAWMVAFVVLLGWARAAKHGQAAPSVVGPWEQAFTSITGSGNFNSADLAWNLVTAVAVLIGIAHIGIFISHVYMLVSRKD